MSLDTHTPRARWRVHAGSATLSAVFGLLLGSSWPPSTSDATAPCEPPVRPHTAEPVAPRRSPSRPSPDSADSDSPDPPRDPAVELQEALDRSYYKGIAHSWDNHSDQGVLSPAEAEALARHWAAEAGVDLDIDCTEPPCIVAFRASDRDASSDEFERRLFEALMADPGGCEGPPAGFGTAEEMIVVPGWCLASADEAEMARVHSRVDSWLGSAAAGPR